MQGFFFFFFFFTDSRLKELRFDSSSFSAEGTLISASIAPRWGGGTGTVKDADVCSFAYDLMT